MRWPLVSRGYDAALVLFLALVAHSVVFAGQPCPPKPVSPVVLKSGVLKITPAAEDVTLIDVFMQDGQLVVYYGADTYSFNACKVCSVRVDASKTVAGAEVNVVNETAKALVYLGGAGSAGIQLADGDADLFGGVGDLSATLGDGKVYVECGAGTSFVTGGTGLLCLIADDVGSVFLTLDAGGYSLVETGSGDAFVTATAGEGVIFVEDPTHAFLDLTSDYCVENRGIPCWLVFLFLICW